jgi:hypothetical protein
MNMLELVPYFTLEKINAKGWAVFLIVYLISSSLSLITW